jgi:hypothetical protein
MATGESTAPAKRSVMGTEVLEPADVNNFFWERHSISC